MPLKSKFICPFCFEEHKISDVQFRCTNRRCKDVPDLELTRYENGDESIPKMGKPTFKAPSGGLSIPKSARCPELLTGKNSVSPWMSPISTDCNNDIRHSLFFRNRIL